MSAPNGPRLLHIVKTRQLSAGFLLMCLCIIFSGGVCQSIADSGAVEDVLTGLSYQSYSGSSLTVPPSLSRQSHSHPRPFA